MVRVWVGVFLLVPANVAFFFPNWVSALPTPVVVLTLLPVWCWSWRMRSNKKKIVNLGSKHRDSCQRKRRNKNNLYWYFKNDYNSLSSLSDYNSISRLQLFAFNKFFLIRICKESWQNLCSERDYMCVCVCVRERESRETRCIDTKNTQVEMY